MATMACCRRPAEADASLGRGREDRHQGGQRVEVADEQQILQERDHRRHQRAPARVVLFHPKQVEKERQIEPAQLARRHRGEPAAQALGRIVVDLIDRDGLALAPGQLAGVAVRHERLVGVPA